MGNDQTEKSTPLLVAIIRHSLDHDREREITEGSDEERVLWEEVEVLSQDPACAALLLEELFPGGIPFDTAFYGRLCDLSFRLGFGEVAERTTGLLWAAAVRQVDGEAAQNLLRALPSVGQDFFVAISPLPVLFEEIEIEPTFAAEWFPAIVRRIGNDLASGGFWQAMGTFCERQMVNALRTLQLLLKDKEDQAIAVAAYLLGTLRTLEMKEPVTIFEEIEASCSASGDPTTRSVYHRSWIQASWRGMLTLSDLQRLVAHFSFPDEQQEAFFVVCRSLLAPTSAPECLSFGLSWIRKEASPTLSPEAKHIVTDFAVELFETGRGDASDVILSIQPIPIESRGTWKRVEALLVSLLSKGTDAFDEFCLKLAERNARGWHRVMHDPRSFEWLFSKMRGTDRGRLVGQLVLSSDAGCRKLGLFFFDKLDLSVLPADIFKGIEEARIRLALYEGQRTMMHGVAIARYLMLFMPYLQHTSKEFQQEFREEVILQAKNYGGACVKEFEGRVEELPLLKEVLETVSSYFDKLQEIRHSSICAMEVPGYRRAARIHGRRFSNDVSKGAEDYSIFAQMFKKVQLLYGKSWRTFLGGRLGDASDLQTISNSIELPRLEFIDPEGMLLRRLNASAQIAALSRGADSEEDE